MSCKMCAILKCIKTMNALTADASILKKSTIKIDRYIIKIIAFTIIFQMLIKSTFCGLINSRASRETLIESYIQNLTQPDGSCLHNGIPMSESTVNCEIKSGCRAIQKTGYCCPEYQCDCERNGKLYQNNEKVIEPEKPCKVCYCQGGDIVCSSISCYKRDDCEPKFVNGKCCPEYDNCPPIEITKLTTSKPKETAIDRQKLDKNGISDHNNGILSKSEVPLINSLNITIKEITKKEEIRITDAPSQHEINLIPTKTTSIITTAETTTASSKVTQNQPSDINNLNYEDTHGNSDGSNKIIRQTESSLNLTVSGANDTNLLKNKESIIEDEIVVFHNENNLNSTHNHQIEPEETQTNENLSHEIIFDNSKGSIIDYKSDSDIDPLASSSDDFFRVISSTTEGIKFPNNNTDSNNETNYDLDLENVMANDSSFLLFDLENDTISTQGPGNVLSEPIAPVFPHHSEDEDDGQSTSESNPAYPVIEEDLSNYRLHIEQPRDETDEFSEHNPQWQKKVTEEKEEPRSAHEDIQPSDDTIFSQRIINFNNESEHENSSNIIDFDQIQPRAPGEPCLIPEWEKDSNSTEYRCNSTIQAEDIGMFSPLKLNDTEDTWHNSSEEVDFDSGVDSDDSAPEKLREPTTPRNPKIIDIDGITSSTDNSTSLATDPKNDAESLKIESNEETKPASSDGTTGGSAAEEIQINTKSNKAIVDSYKKFYELIF